MNNNIINENTITSLEILSQLALSPEEQKQAMADLEDMVEFVHKMQEVDTAGEEPLSHIFPVCNVFREDKEIAEQDSERNLQSDIQAELQSNLQSILLANAPARQGDFFEVPRTI